jgi:3-deoxy-manno-octulosonate cytidylyltransferase (CMP-KDO synthetase)
MKVLGVIPARYGSVRFPGKPLALIHGITMIERVYRKATRSEKLSKVLVATDDQRIFDHVVSFGGNVTLTAADHPNGTSRCVEVIEKENEEYEAVVNIQGDEPYINPKQIDEVVSCLIKSGAGLATLVKKITDPADLDNINIPKVVRQQTGYALYFSRTMIPWCKPSQKANLVEKGVFFKHVGLYGYRKEVLRALPLLLDGTWEEAESLEQLRWLERGMHIMTAITEHESHAVDVPNDISKLESLFNVSD